VVKSRVQPKGTQMTKVSILLTGHKKNDSIFKKYKRRFG
jgi:hypothetical protein